MIAERLLSELESRGATCAVFEDRLRIEAPQGAVSPEFLAELRAHKTELLQLLTWPPECFEAERTHGRPSARLYPLIRQLVETPQGQGVLVNALPERAVVALDGQLHPIAVLPTEVKPVGAARYPDDLELWVH